MISRRIQPIAAALLALLTLAACDPPKPTAETPTTWSWRDDAVGVALRLDSAWEQLDPRVIHAQAVFAARSEADRFSLHMLVVDLPGGDALEHDLGQLRAQSVEQLERSVGAFELERQGPITLDETPGQSVFALGDVGGVRYSYILTYTIASGRLYQLVATSRAEDATQLATLVDGVLVTWDFLDGT
jgi:hypothetical protein